MILKKTKKLGNPKNPRLAFLTQRVWIPSLPVNLSLSYYTNPLSVISEGISKPSPFSWFSLSARSPLLLGVFMVSLF